MAAKGLNDEVAQGGCLEAARRDLKLRGEGQLKQLLGGPLLPGAKVEDLERLTAGLGKDTYH